MHGEDGGVPGGSPDDDWAEDAESDRTLGWIPPDDRLWRHPSETSPSGVPRVEVEAWGAAAQTRSARPGPWVIGGLTVCILVALVATSLVMADTNQNSSTGTTPGTASFAGVPTTGPGISQMTSANQIDAAVAAIRPSMVVLLVTGSTGTVASTGVVAESGGIIVTSSRTLDQARAITVVEANGTRRTATFIGADKDSGLAVVQIVDDLPAATFDDDDPSAGTVAMAVAMQPGTSDSRPPVSLVYAGTVVSSGETLAADTVTPEFATTVINAPLGQGDIGCALLDGEGHLTGMMEMASSSGASTTSVFLPAEVVLGVARQLVSSSAVDPGWLGISPAPTSPATGAVVGTVAKGSPAALAGLQPGDAIVALDGHQVHSEAELRTRLYADPPGTPLAVTYQRGGITVTTSVVLADQDPDAPGGGSSP